MVREKEMGMSKERWGGGVEREVDTERDTSYIYTK